MVYEMALEFFVKPSIKRKKIGFLRLMLHGKFIKRGA